MAYTISKTNGGTLVVLNDGIVDSSICSINLIGKNVSNFGDAQNENFVHLLENFAYYVEPKQPLQGQLWFDSVDKVFRPAVFDGRNWRPLAVCLYHTTTTDTLVNAGGFNFAASRPGDFWFDSNRKQLHVVTSGTFTATQTVLIGPEGVPDFGTTKLSSVAMRDSLQQPHPVIQMILDGEVIGVMSNVSFTSNSDGVSLGFPKINRGLTLKSYSSGTRYVTTSSDVALYGILDHLDSSYTRKNINEHITSSWTVDTGADLYFGTNYQSLISWNQPTTSLLLATNGNIKLQSGSQSVSFNGTSLVASNSGINIGSSSTVFGTAFVSTLSSGGTLAYGTIDGSWNLTNGSSISPQFDTGANLGTQSRRFDTLYVRNIETGNSGQSQLTGVLSLSTGSSIAPSADSGNTLGSSNSRFSNIFTRGVSAGSSADSLSLVGEISLNGNLKPAINNVGNLGTLSNQWKEIYSKSINASTATVSTVKATVVESSSLASASLSSNNASFTNVSFSTITDSFANAITKFDKDVTLAANSHGQVSTQKAVKTYVDVTKQYLIDMINNLQASLQGQISGITAVPPGTVFFVAMQSVPAGYIFCNGAALSKITYPALFAALGYTYGGSGNTFYIPDLRGEFIRGWDAGRSLDPGRGFGTVQGDQFRAHNHGVPGDDQWTYANGIGGWVSSSRGAFSYDAISNLSGGGQVWNSTTEGGSETRPRNIALLPIIKI